ncbi:MAG: HAD family hydrolase [Gemmatimonadota bacterium]|nr:HAD family hydrolase [Gemmatimonadota bacterium]
MKSVIWDFNGTILDDVELATRSMNELLRRRELPTIDKATHRQVFRFPVSDYYRHLGFDLDREVQRDISDEFHSVYQAGIGSCSLNPGIAETLEYLEKHGIDQFVLSAAQEEMVVSWVRIHGIQDRFKGVYGLSDRLAVSKEQRCRELIEDFDLDPSRTLFIGDTDHDVEVARAVGCLPLVVLQGHQDKFRFAGAECEIYDSFHDLVKALPVDGTAGRLSYTMYTVRVTG